MVDPVKESKCWRRIKVTIPRICEQLYGNVALDHNYQNEGAKKKKNRGRPIKISVPRFQQERCFAWFQRKYRRLVVRWERISACFNAFISLATIHIWINRILLLG